MSTLILLDAISGHVTVPQEDPATIIAVWDRGNVPEGQLSIPKELADRLVQIRTELAAWTYETGCARIGDHLLEEHLRAGDSLSMWWCSTLMEKHTKVTRNLFSALKLRALELVLEERSVTQLTLITPKETDSALSDVLERFCLQTGRTFRVIHKEIEEKPEDVSGSLSQQIKTKLKSVLVSWYYALPGPLKALVRFGDWLWKIRLRLPRTELARPVLPEGVRPASIVTYFPNIDMNATKEGRFRSRYWESLHELLAPATGEPHRVNWVFLYYPAPQCSFVEAIALRDCFRASGQDGASFFFLEEFLTTGDIWRSLIRYIRLAWAGRRIEPEVRKLFYFSGSHMDLWPLLKPNWSDSVYGWRALERCLMREAFRRYVQWAGPQEWVLFPQENCPWERMLAQSVHEQNAGPIYGAQHSTVRPSDFRYFDDPRMIEDPTCRKAMLDLWLCNGSGAENALLAAGMPKRCLEMVEALRYQYLGALPQEGANQTPVESPTRLLIVTSFFADETEAHLQTLAESIQQGVLRGWEVVVKPHPYLPVEQRLKELLGSDAPPVAEGAIGSFLTPGTVVWASNSTTVALEAAYRSLPVLVQAADKDVDLCPLQGLPGVVSVRTASDVASALADPRAPELPTEYLALDPALPRWKKILGY